MPMVNWRGPLNIELEYFGVVKVVYFVLGVLTWEILSTLYFDWQIITGRRVFRWTYFLYAGCRFGTFGNIIGSSVGFDIASRFDCQVWIVIDWASGYSGIALASALLALRTIAFWNNNKIVFGLAISVTILHVSFLIFAVTQAHSVWDPESNACVESHTHDNIKNFFATIFTDFSLFTMMLCGIWKRRKAGELWKLVYRQGVLWVAGATLGEFPCVILTLLNYNDPMNLILQPFASLAMTICATKMYRELSEYANPVSNTQYSSIDIAPMKFKTQPSSTSTPTVNIVLSTTGMDEEFGRRSSNNVELDLSFDYSYKPEDT